MAVTPSTFSTALIPTQAFLGSRQPQFVILRDPTSSSRTSQKKNKPPFFSDSSCCCKASSRRMPSDSVELPKAEPKFEAPSLGFTMTAEVWNSRVCMIGLVGTFIVELIINKGILQLIGVEVGKGLNLPL